MDQIKLLNEFKKEDGLIPTNEKLQKIGDFDSRLFDICF